MEQELRDIAAKWMVKAGNDLKTAAQGLAAQEVITDSVCFHAQQAAEKYLKAFLVSRNSIPEKTHKIERLLAACEAVDGAFGTLADAVLLTEYAVALRYVDDFFIPSEDEARSAYRLAVRVKDFVRERIRPVGFETSGETDA